jgi:hypothetical protein
MTYARVVVAHYGGPMSWVAEEAPEPKQGEVRGVLAAGVRCPRDDAWASSRAPALPYAGVGPWRWIARRRRLGIEPGELLLRPIHGAYARCRNAARPSGLDAPRRQPGAELHHGVPDARSAHGPVNV